MDTHYDIVHLEEVASTQDEAALAFALSRTATLVVADRQVLGRGRGGRAWLEPDIGMYSSLAVEPRWDPSDLPLIPLVAAVAVHRILRSIAGAEVDLKWPNDLLEGERKVGGILVEAVEGVVVIGCGINLWWMDPPPYAASIFSSAVGSDVASTIARGWAEELLRLISAGARNWPAREYRMACVTIGRRVRWDEGAGMAKGIDDSGALIVIDEAGEHRVVSGDVHLLGES